MRVTMGYDLSNLSHSDFENLVRDLLQAEEGTRYESFAQGPDSGIDCRLRSDDHLTIVQVKHYARSGYSKLLSTLKAEANKVSKVGPQRYVVATSVAMTPNRKKEISTLFEPFCDNVIVEGAEDIANMLELHPEVLKSHYKLWLGGTAVLERIVHKGLANKAEIELLSIESLLPTFVDPGTVSEATNLLNDNHVLIITGTAGIGKTSLAKIVSYLHLDSDWKLHIIDNLDEAFSAIEMKENTLIYFDDFLGQTDISLDTIRQTDSRLVRLIEQARRSSNLRLILTTRKHLFSQAVHGSERFQREQINVSEFVLDVSSYNRRVRAEILFNHIVNSPLSDQQVAQFSDVTVAKQIVDHDNYNPRLISSIVVLCQEHAPEDIAERAFEILNSPDDLWRTSYYNSINDYARCLLISKLFHLRTASLADLKSLFVRLTQNLGLSLPAINQEERFREAFRQVEGLMLVHVGSGVTYINPGVEDFIKSVLVQDSLFPAVLQSLSRFDELERALGLVSQVPSHQHPDPHEWIAQLRAALESNGPTLDSIEITGRFRPLIGNDTANELIQEQLEATVATDHSPEAIADCLPILEDAIDESENERFACYVRGWFIDFARENLNEYLSTPDRVGYILETIHYDEEIARELSNGLEHLFKETIESFQGFVDQCTDEDEIDSLRYDFRKMVEQYSESTARDIDYYAERAAEDVHQNGPSQDGQPNAPSRVTRDKSLSDQELAAMFGRLKER